MRGAKQSDVEPVHEIHPVLQDPDPLLGQIQPGYHGPDGPVGELKLAHPPVDVLPGRSQVLGMLPGLPATMRLRRSRGERIQAVHVREIPHVLVFIRLELGVVRR